MIPAWQSIRFRLSVQYSALVFGLGGALLGLLYLAVERELQSPGMMTEMWEGREVVLVDGTVYQLGSYSELEVKAIETIYNQIVLYEVTLYTLIAIGILFLLSIVIGWIMSGRVLKPVGEITAVANDIQASDLSRRIALQGPDDELKNLADTFDEMLDRLDAAFSSQRQFLADTSHDLRTPLTIIRSNVELVAGDPDADIDDWRRAGGVIQRNAERMSAMIQGLLATARMQTEKAKAITVDLADLVDSKVADFAPVAAEKSVEIEGRPGQANVQGIEVALDRALTNLIDNAVKAAPEGSTVLVSSGMREGWAWLGVLDDGPGLPDDTDDRVGLGLSIVSQVAESHGGALAAYTGRGERGATMVIWLPTGESGRKHPDRAPFTNTS
jgi:signal transduction histidine kinase